MAKNRNKKKKNGLDSMDFTSDQLVTDTSQAMEITDSAATRPSHAGSHIKLKGKQMKRTKNVRKMKAVARAISKNEKVEEKELKKENKKLRTQSAKKLYD